MKLVCSGCGRTWGSSTPDKYVKQPHYGCPKKGVWTMPEGAESTSPPPPPPKPQPAAKPRRKPVPPSPIPGVPKRAILEVHALRRFLLYDRYGWRGWTAVPITKRVADFLVLQERLEHEPRLLEAVRSGRAFVVEPSTVLAVVANQVLAFANTYKYERASELQQAIDALQQEFALAESWAKAHPELFELPEEALEFLIPPAEDTYEYTK